MIFANEGKKHKDMQRPLGPSEEDSISNMSEASKIQCKMMINLASLKGNRVINKIHLKHQEHNNSLCIEIFVCPLEEEKDLTTILNQGNYTVLSMEETRATLHRLVKQPYKSRKSLLLHKQVSQRRFFTHLHIIHLTSNNTFNIKRQSHNLRVLLLQ